MMTKRKAAILFFFTVFFAVFIYRDSLAKIIWSNYRSASLAIFLTRDAKFAVSIGNDFFNGQACAKTSRGKGCYDLDKAELAFKKAVSLNPEILWGHYQLARIYFVRKDFKNALREVSLELEYNPENLRSLYVRGLIYAYNGDLALAESDFRTFTMWSPQEWAGYNDLAWILAKEGKYKEDLAMLERAFKMVPKAEENPWLQNSLGVAYLNLGKISEAKKSFLAAKASAANLNLKDWRRAYPGNNPSGVKAGFEVFKEAIEANLLKASGVDKTNGKTVF